MAREWRSVALADLTEPDSPITYGVVKPGPEDASGVLFIRGGDIADGRVLTEQLRTITQEVSDQYKRTLLRGGELVVSLVGNPGQVAIVPPELRGANIARQVGLIRLRADVDPRFVKYALSSTTGQFALGAHSLGSVQQVINLRDLKTVRLLLPELHEQRAIAAVLGALDDKIELNRRMCRTLEGIAQALFQAWFVDFLPVRAKAGGARSFRGMPQAVFDILPTQFVDSPLGPIPKGWRVARAGDVAEVNAWTLGRSDDLDYIDYIEISEVMRGEIGQIVRYERGAEPSRARRRLRHGDTVLSTVRPDRGARFLCLNPPDSLIASTGFAVLSPRNGMWAFLYSAMTRPDVNDELGRLADGGAYPAVRPEVVAACEFVMPGDQAITRAFEAVAESLFEKAWHCRHQSRTLGALRDALLPKLVSGELRIRDLERIIGRAI